MLYSKPEMPSLQTIHVKGNTYYRLVSCRRINGKPTPVVLAYLGKADDILQRIEAADEARVRSWSHGAVAALYALAHELRLAERIDAHLSSSGRRLRPSSTTSGPLPPQKNDGLTVGQSLALVAIGRACCATSKRAFAEGCGRWALVNRGAPAVGQVRGEVVGPDGAGQACGLGLAGRRSAVDAQVLLAPRDRGEGERVC